MTQDPPNPDGVYAGLYFNTIRQLVESGHAVFTVSLTACSRDVALRLLAIGASPILPEDLQLRPSYRYTVLHKLFLKTGLYEPGREYWISSKAFIDFCRSTIKPVLILGLQSYTTGIAARYIAKKLRVNYTTWEHLSGYQRKKQFRYSDRQICRMLQECKAFAAVSPHLLTAIRHRLKSELGNGIVLPNPIPDEFSKYGSNAYFRETEKVSITSYRFAAWTNWRDGNKRLDLLLHAFSLARQKRPSIKLLIAGHINDEIKRQNWFTDKSENVDFVGNLSRNALVKFVYSIDCCCITSDVETFSLPFVEAISAGKPVLSTRCGGPEYFLDRLGNCGKLVKSGDLIAFSDAMVEVYDQRMSFDASMIKQLAFENFGDTIQRQRWTEFLNRSLIPDILI